MKPGTNFQVRLIDGTGNTVDGSTREGHNVFTSYGRSRLARLVAFSSLEPDVPYGNSRLRYFGVGSGTQSNSVDVVSLNAPLPVVTGNYFKEIDASLVSFPNYTTVQYRLVLSPSDVSGAGTALVSESGLFFGERPYEVLTTTGTPAFYNTFEPLMKTGVFSLEILWELRF